MTGGLIKSLPDLKFIARVGSGLENIDVRTAAKRGVKVINSPEGNRTAVGEHTVGMILSLFHKICSSDKQIRQGFWQRETNRGYELEGKTVGIIGYGNMGSAVAQRLSGFGCTVLAYDKYKKNYSDAFVLESRLEAIFDFADIVSLHVPLTDETFYMINDDFIKKMKKNFYLINTSRGKVVDTAAVVKGLKTGKIQGLALDVLEYENFDFALDKQPHKDFEFLKTSPNVILTPHIAGLTKESFRKLSEVIAAKILENFQ
jgi:D-3-phosphoglycerate dehydrogenase